jgi:predicted enzyme related to lactoylglutathione lyase
MSTRTSYSPGTPCWVELSGTPDIEASARFYGDLFGWEVPELPNSAELGGYRRAKKDGKDVAGVSPRMEDGQPTVWATYISVADADATLAKAGEAGGQTIVEPMDVAGLGKMAVFTDPEGAVIGIWEPGTFAGAELVNEPGAFAWNEFNTRDSEGAKSFYGGVFGWGFVEHEIARDAGGGTYVEFTVDGNSAGGILDMRGRVPDQVPPNWLVYFAVEDTDAALEQVKSGGGTVAMGPIDIPAGRFGVAMDPAGAAFAVIKGAEQS